MALWFDIHIFGQIGAGGLLESAHTLNAVQIVGNSVGEFEDIGSSVQAGPEVRFHVVPTAVVQFLSERDEHSLLTCHALDKASNFLSNVCRNVAHETSLSGWSVIQAYDGFHS